MADFDDITGWREELEVFEESEERKAYFRQHLNDSERRLPFDVVLDLAELMLKHEELRDAVRQRAEFRAFIQTRPDLTNDDDEFWEKNPLDASETLEQFMTWYASKTRVPYRHFPLSKGKELAIAVVAGDLASLEYTFELISRDLELLDHRLDDPKHPLYGLQFDRLSTRSALTWLATHPDVPHNQERLQSLLKAIHAGKFDLSKERGITTHELERERYHLPDTYEDAMRERSRRAETEPGRRSDIRGLSSQADARLGVAPVDQGAAVPLSPSGAPLEGQLDGLTGSQTGGEIGGRIDPDSGPSGKASGSLQKGPGIGAQFMEMWRKGAPIAIIGVAFYAVNEIIMTEVERSGRSYQEVARETDPGVLMRAIAFGKGVFPRNAANTLVRSLASETAVDVAQAFHTLYELGSEAVEDAPGRTEAVHLRTLLAAKTFLTAEQGLSREAVAALVADANKAPVRKERLKDFDVLHSGRQSEKTALFSFA